MFSPLRTLIIWVVLIVLFVAFYQFFSAAPGEHGTAISSHATTFLSWLPLLVVVSIVAVVAFALRRGQVGSAMNQEGVTLLNQGRFVEALAKFEEAKPRLKASAALLDYNIGLVRLSLWQPREAEAALELALQKNRFPIPKIGNLVIPNRALARALQGKLDAAQNDLEEAARLGAEATATALVAAAVIAARRGEWRKTADLVNRYEVKQLGGTGRGLADALSAWANEQLTGQKRHVDLIALYGETGPETVRQVWPELVAFLNTAS